MSNTGIEEKVQIPLPTRNEKVKRILFHALLMFITSFCSLSCLNSAFELQIYMPVVVLILGLFSVYAAAFHYSKSFKYIGYILFLVLFCVSVWQFREAINSGFSHFMNQLMKILEDYFNLPILQEYKETIANARYSSTICVSFIGVVLILLLNITISEYMSVFGTLVLTLPIGALGLYFEVDHNLLYFTGLIAVYLTLMILRKTDAYHLLVKNKTLKYKNKKGVHYYIPVLNHRAIYKIGLPVLFVTLGACILLQMVIPKKKVNISPIFSPLKTFTDETVRNIALIGLDGMLGRQSGKGGMSDGKLGDVDRIRNEYTTDLLFSYMPIEDEDIYLKAFIGSVYHEDCWTPIETPDLLLDQYKLDPESVMSETTYAPASLEDMDTSIKQTYFEVSNMDANENYLYLPYGASCKPSNYECYANNDDCVRFEIPDKYIISGRILNQTEDVSYNDEIENIWFKMWDDYKEYEEYVKAVYLQIPDENREVVSSILEENHISATDKDVIDRVKKYLSQECSYSLMPGKTPKNKDFVNYFLIEKKKGYCAHFASAATLMFRALGIPARYIEGYVVPKDAENIGYSGDREERIIENSKNVLNPEAGIKTVEVLDKDAHAWVEIFKDGWGWIPIEVTPPSDGEEEENIFSENQGIFNNIDLSNVFTEENITKIQKTTISTMKLMLIIILATSVLYVAIGLLFICYRRKYMGINDIKNFRYTCAYFYRTLAKLKLPRFEGETLEEYTKRMVKDELINKDESKQLLIILEESLYSEQNVPSKENMEICRNSMFSILDKQYKKRGKVKGFLIKYFKWI